MKLGVTGLTTSTLTAVLLASTTLTMASSHREAPGITEERKIDGTDFYMFRSYEPGREDFVTIIANYQPGQNPHDGPNYYTLDPEALYEIHVDNDGDAIEDLTFQFDFDNNLRDGTGITLNIGGKDLPIALRHVGEITEIDDPQQGEREFFGLTLVTGDRRSGNRQVVTNANGGDSTFPKPIDNIGSKSLPDYGDYADEFIHDIAIPGCDDGRAFAGQRSEAFAINLGGSFDLVNYIPVEGDSSPGAGDGGGFPGGITQDRVANDDLVGRVNVTSLALEIPISCLVGDGNGVIGAWTTSSLPQAQLKDPSPTYEQTALFGGAFVQRSRLANPLVNELVIGINNKDLFNAAEPMGDAALADFVTNPTFPEILDILFKDAVNATLGTNIANLEPTNIPRNDLVATFLTGFANVNQLATVTPSEIMRLNTGIPITPREQQNNLGVIGGDVAGYPNGRRPGDDAADITLRVAMGRLCHPIAGVTDAQDPEGTLGLCNPEDASTGLVPFTDGAPISALDLQNEFPYLNGPYPGAGGGEPMNGTPGVPSN